MILFSLFFYQLMCVGVSYIKYQGIRETEEWTDEKHSMYIKSIEASFVNDLYDSKQTGVSFSSKGKPNESSTGQVSFPYP
jgi:hypothetical protein